ncbi:hypothetical protein DYH09_00635 [bacterium CPR1]|nr:hypothetical protein [bacterium CPR1]
MSTETQNAVASPATRRFPCPGCGATLVFAAGAGNLRCEYCDAEVEIPKEAPTASTFSGPVEHALSKLLSGEANKGWGVQTYSVACKQCGATTTFPEKTTSGECAFCASRMVAEKPADATLITPETLIPFKVTKEQAAQKFSAWVRSLWLRPNNLKRMARVHDINGLYTPFWTFDANAETRWKAESGYYYQETEHYTDNEGKRQTRTVTKTRWQPSSGHHFGTYDDILICASKGLSESLVKALEPFNTKTQLVGYKPEYLSGWAAEEYGVGPRDGWEKGQKEFERLEYNACAREVPGDTHRNLQISMRLDNVTWKHVLLPVYVAAYRYQGKSYRFLVNGETGKVSGEAPYSFWKVLFLVLAILAIIYMVVVLGGDGKGSGFVPPMQAALAQIWWEGAGNLPG